MDAFHWKASKLDFSAVLTPAVPGDGVQVTKSCAQEHGLDKSFDSELLERLSPAIERKERVRLELPIRNVHRTVGARIAGEVARRHGKNGLPPDTVELRFSGSAGQSFGAFSMEGMSLHLEGDANDYIGKGMSGGLLSVRPPRAATFRADQSVLIGNVALYGATGGKAFFSGIAGERFAVRNSGAIAVVEGVGDHGCEYMTGGQVLVIGRTGRNFAAGMSGGLAFVLDESGDFATRCNQDLVELETPSTEDATRIAALLEEHRASTGSVKAGELLARWDETLPRFVKVVPTEYRRVLAELARKRAQTGGETSAGETQPGPSGSSPRATEAE